MDTNPSEVVETNTAPETPAEQPSAPAETPVAAAPAAPAEPDWKSQFEATQNELNQFRQHYQQQSQAQSQYQQQMQEFMLRTFAPDVYKQRQEPRYATVEMMQEMQRKASEDAQASMLAQQYRGEISSAKEAFPDVFAIPGIEHAIGQEWQRSGKSVNAIVKEFDAALSKQFEARQAKYVAQKQQVAQQVKGSPKSGGAPSPKGTSGVRGFARIAAALKGDGD